MTFYAPRNITPADQILFDANGNPVGIQPAGSSQPPLMGLTPTERTAVQSLVSDDGLVDAVVAAYSVGLFATPAGTRLGTIASVPTASILLDAGSGGTVSSARVTFAPPTDTIGAQRLHTPTAETYTLTMDSALVVTLGDLDGIALVMHAIGVSTDAVLTGESYVAESDYTLAEYMAGDARFEWLDSTPTRVRLTLQRGSSTRYATLSVVAEVSA